MTTRFRSINLVSALLALAAGCGGGGTSSTNPDAAPAGGGSGGRAGSGGAGGAAGSSGSDAGVVSCTPATRECRGNELAVCASDGMAWHTVNCGNGCVEPDAGTGPGCRPTTLSTGWTLFKFPLTDDSVQTEAAYSFESDGLVAVQTANALPSAYVNDTSLANVVVKGRFTVNTAGDDDLVGFVFGWQDQQHFYLLDWKQADQNDGTCGNSLAGVSLKVVSSDTAVNQCVDFWASAGSTRTRTLSGPPAQNAVGWVDLKAYDFTLRWKAGDIQIEIKDGDTVVATVTSNDATYPTGKFGFYNYSQEQVRYEFFVIEPTP